MTWDFASDPEPDIVISAAGDYLTKECLAAIDIVKNEAPEIKMRFVNIMELSGIGMGNPDNKNFVFENYFTKDKPVIFSFHGYPQTLKQILFDYGNSDRFSVHGYTEHGSTTTPFDMHIWNQTSRWHLALEIFQKMNKDEDLIQKYQQKIKDFAGYIKEHGVDPEEIENWKWTRNS